MTNTSLLERERLKLSWLRQKLAEQEQFVRELEGREDDALDAAFQREFLKAPEPTPQDSRDQDTLVAASSPMPTVNEVLESGRVGWSLTRPLKSLPSRWIDVMIYIGVEGKTFPEIMNYIERRKLGFAVDTVRAGLMNYRRDYGLLENPKRGFYRVPKPMLDKITAMKN